MKTVFNKAKGLDTLKQLLFFGEKFCCSKI